MNDLLAPAILNLVAHCEAVLGAHGCPSSRTPGLWTNQHSLDIPYGHAMTLAGPESAAEQLVRVERFLGDRPSGVATVVTDSHSSLDLRPLGLEVLFADPWFVREPGTVGPGPEVGLEIVEVGRSPELLLEFDEADRAGFESGSKIRSYLDPLLEDGRYRFLIGRVDGRAVSGVLTFNDGVTVGVYGLFTLREFRGRGYGAAIVRAALERVGVLPAVTNPSEVSQRIFAAQGFREAGTRTLWWGET